MDIANQPRKNTYIAEVANKQIKIIATAAHLAQGALYFFGDSEFEKITMVIPEGKWNSIQAIDDEIKIICDFEDCVGDCD